MKKADIQRLELVDLSSSFENIMGRKNNNKKKEHKYTL